jgi:hypothetical protein
MKLYVRTSLRVKKRWVLIDQRGRTAQNYMSLITCQYPSRSRSL